MSDAVFLGQKAASMELDDTVVISRVNIDVDSQHYYTAGTDSGTILNVYCPWASQSMAESVLTAVNSYIYQPFTAEDALLDPAAELGDAVTVGGVYSIIASANIDYNRASVAEISAPGLDEIDDEYPYITQDRKETNKVLAATRSLISKSSTEILLQVEGLVGEVEDSVASLQITVDGINLRVEGIDEEAEELGLQVSEISMKMDSLTLSVSNEQTSSTLKLMAGSTQLSSANITFTGFVKFTDLSTSGATTISGNNITTGMISADRIDVSNLLVKSVWTADGQRVMLTSTGVYSNLTVIVGGNGDGWQSGQTHIAGSEVFIGPSDQSAALVIRVENNVRKITSPLTWQWGGSGTTDKLGNFYISDLHCDDIIPRTGATLGNSSYAFEELRVKKIIFASAPTYELEVSGSSGVLQWGGKNMTAGNTTNVVNVNQTATIWFGGASTSNYIIADDSELRPSVTNSGSGYSYLGIAGAYWSHAYIGRVRANIGLNVNSVVAFYGGSGTIRQTLSTTSNNQNYTSANANNYLYILNNIAGILKKLGLIG